MVCDWCGKYIFERWWENWGNGCYCSEQCANAARLNHLNCRCRWCGKQYDPAEIRTSGQVIWPGFCSEACHDAFEQANPRPPVSTPTAPTAPSADNSGIRITTFDFIETFGSPYGRFVSTGTACRCGEASNITFTNVGWTFDKNKVTVNYQAITNNSPWETGALRIGIYTSNEKGHFNFEAIPSIGTDHNDWETNVCFLFASPSFDGLKQGTHYPDGSKTVEIPKEVFKRISKKVYIAVVVEEAIGTIRADGDVDAMWTTRCSVTANNQGIINCLQTKSISDIGTQQAPAHYKGIKQIGKNEESEYCYCEECGAKNKKSNSFCEECGAKLGE